MANYTGQATPVPPLSRNTGTAAPLPDVQYATQSPGNIGAFAADTQGAAQLLDGISNNIQNRMDLAARVNAAREGTLAGGAGLPARRDPTTISGQAFDAAAADAVGTRLDLAGREALSQYELDHMSDPAGFQKKAQGYLQGVVQNVSAYDPVVAQKYSQTYNLQADNILQRIQQRHMAVTEDGQKETALKLISAVQQDQQTLSQQLFTSGAGQVMPIMTQMALNAGKIAQTAHGIGASGDPLFDASTRVRFANAAQQGVSKQIGLAWFSSQPDLAAALSQWQSGKAVIAITDANGKTGEVNLKNILDPMGYQAAEKSFVDNYKSNLALQNQQNTLNDRNFKKSSDQLYGDLGAVAQDGMLTPAMVEAAKSSLAPDKYLALNAMAKGGGATVSDGRVMSGLIAQDAAGNDIRPQLTTAYGNGEISLSDFQSLYERNNNRLDKGVQNPIATGRDYVSGALGGLSKDLGPVGSSSIAQANGEYAQRIDDFQNKNKRQPTTMEALDIARAVTARYSAFDIDTSIVNLPLPKFMTPSQKFTGALSLQDIQAVKTTTATYFLKLHKGDTAAAAADEGYQNQMTLLKQYSDLITQKEQHAVKYAPAK